MPSTFDRLLDRPVRTDQVRLAYFPDDAEKLNEARQAVNLAKMAADADNPPPDAAGDVLEAQEKYETVAESMLTVTFHLRGIGPKRVEQMLAEEQYRPTKKQELKATKENGGRPANLQWNEETFPPALIAACTTKVEMSDDPDNPMEGMSETQSLQLWDAKWSVGDRSLIFMSCLALDQASSQVEELGKD